MNHVQNLHSRVMQKLHELGGQKLPSGSLNEKFSRRPRGNNCLKALKKYLHTGQDAEFAFWL